MKKLPLSYYQQGDVLHISRDLLGKVLMTKFGSQSTGGMIIETEAYRGPEDRASHAYNHRRTKRNEVMYQKGGVAYVYQCYGIHALFNVVVNLEGIPHAILVRAIKPLYGIELMLKRRYKDSVDKTLTGGPGTLTQALGISTAHNGTKLNSSSIWIEDRGSQVSSNQIIESPRVGIDYAGEDALLPWRFRLDQTLSF
jgi:DNA-3-methyladenine glycosylase